MKNALVYVAALSLLAVGLPTAGHEDSSSASSTAQNAPTPAAVVPNKTMTGKVMSGYQGWFNAPNDGSGFGWRHFGDTPGSVGFDMWPDMTEFGPDERYPTKFKHRDGRTAELFSSHNEKTVLRHFQWMRDYGLDGVFLQRFASQTYTTGDIRRRQHVDTILAHVRKGAQQYGRVYGMMYDLSGVREGDMQRIMDDWKYLVDTTRLNKDERYVRHNGKPVVVLWGLGFTGSRQPLLEEGLKFVRFLKEDPVYGGNSVMIGVPYRWRTTDSPQVPFAKMEALIQAADIVSPWAVGVSPTPEAVVKNFSEVVRPDIEWCRARGKEYMPVVFPGFTWYNLRRGTTPSDQIPRLGGRFLWTQYVEAKKAGATMVYQAMFDEVDEGTAIFKVTNDVPVPENGSQFVPLEGLPSDFYLKLVGQATRMVRGEIKPEDDLLVKNAKWTPFTPPLAVIAPTGGKAELLKELTSYNGVVVSSERDEKNEGGRRFLTEGAWTYPGPWTEPGKGKRAIWQVPVPAAGEYRVEMWYDEDPNKDHATRATVQVVHAGGTHTARVNQRERTRTWVSLGTFRFEAGEPARVILDANDAGGNPIAGIVRFTKAN